MTNKPSKKEMAIERAVQILCVVITIAGCLLFGSCAPEGCWDCTNYLIDGQYSEVCVQVDDFYCE